KNGPKFAADGRHKTRPGVHVAPPPSARRARARRADSLAPGSSMHARTRSSLRIVLAAGLVLGASVRSAQAQQAPSSAQSLAPRTPPADVQAPARQTGPTLDAARVAVRQPVASDKSLNSAAVPRRAGYGQPVALMVVGGAGLLTGLIISGSAGTVIAVAGAIVGLYGLYE